MIDPDWLVDASANSGPFSRTGRTLSGRSTRLPSRKFHAASISGTSIRCDGTPCRAVDAQGRWVDPRPRLIASPRTVAGFDSGRPRLPRIGERASISGSVCVTSCLAGNEIRLVCGLHFGRWIVQTFCEGKMTSNFEPTVMPAGESAGPHAISCVR